MEKEIIFKSNINSRIKTSNSNSNYTDSMNSNLNYEEQEIITHNFENKINYKDITSLSWMEALISKLQLSSQVSTNKILLYINNHLNFEDSDKENELIFNPLQDLNIKFNNKDLVKEDRIAFLLALFKLTPLIERLNLILLEKLDYEEATILKELFNTLNSDSNEDLGKNESKLSLNSSKFKFSLSVYVKHCEEDQVKILSEILSSCETINNLKLVFLKSCDSKIVNSFFNSILNSHNYNTKNNQILKSLDISGNQLSAYHIESLLVTPQVNNLTMLSLKSNKLGQAGCLLISKLIKNECCEIKQLDLELNYIDNNGLILLAEGFQFNNSVEEVIFNRNLISDTGIEFFSSALLYNKILKKISLNGNRITNQGLKYLGKYLKSNQCSAYEVLVGFNKVSIQGSKKLFKDLKFKLAENPKKAKQNENSEIKQQKNTENSGNNCNDLVSINSNRRCAKSKNGNSTDKDVSNISSNSSGIRNRILIRLTGNLIKNSQLALLDKSIIFMDDFTNFVS